MSRPVIGIIGASFLIHDDYHIFGAGKLNTVAVAEACGAVPSEAPLLAYLQDKFSDLYDLSL